MANASDTAHTYNRLSKAYALLADTAEQAARDRGVALLDAQPGERVLEVGSGTGRALVRIASRVGPCGLVCGLDISAKMLAVTADRLGQTGSRGYLQRGDGQSLPYAASAFDAVFMSFTLELFEPRVLCCVLTEVKRVLRSSGRLTLVCLNKPTRRTLAVYTYGWLHRRLPHWVDCRPIAVRDVLGAHGFRVMVAEEMRIWGLPVLACLAFPASTRS